MSRILDDIETGRGFSDREAELVVRWLWKLDGLFWHVSHPASDYSPAYTLRERVLRPLDGIRGQLILALALCERIDSAYADAPMGMDSCSEDGIFVSGVFSRTGIMVALAAFAHLIPKQFSTYRLSPTCGEPCVDAKFFYPPTTCATDTQLVGLTMQCSHRLTAAHESYKRQLQAKP